MTDGLLDRRRFVRGIGAATVVVGLAGCSGSGDGDGSEGTTTSEADGGRATPSVTGTDGGRADPSAIVEGYLSDVDNYDGIVDRTDSASATVAVGAEGNGSAYAFAPAAIRVDTGTAVTWEWTGDGGSHNVAAEDGSFDSELVAETGHTFSHTFEQSGIYTYYCSPHKSLGMKAAVVVE